MTIYDLTQALKHYKKPILVAFGTLFVVATILTFTFKDGKPTLRAGLKYESSTQIAVVKPGTSNLLTTGDSSAYADDAAVYAGLLESDEAARWIADQIGTSLAEPISASSSRSSSVISITVTTSSAESAAAGALATYEWLKIKVQEPIETSDFTDVTPTIPVISLDSPFESFIDVDLSPELERVANDLFLLVDHAGSSQIELPVARSAGTTVRSRAVLEPFATAVLQLTDGNNELLDTVRLAPDPITGFATSPPILLLTLGPDAIVRFTPDEGVRTWVIDGDDVSIEWVQTAPAPGSSNPEVAVASIDLALISPDPGATSIGGRRGPIVAVAALIVGSILILTAVIVADTWKQQALASAGVQVDSISDEPAGAASVEAAEATPDTPDDRAPDDNAQKTPDDANDATPNDTSDEGNAKTDKQVIEVKASTAEQEADDPLLASADILIDGTTDITVRTTGLEA